MIDLTFVLRSLKGRCHGNEFWTKSAKLAYLTFIQRIGIPKRIGTLMGALTAGIIPRHLIEIL